MNFIPLSARLLVQVEPWFDDAETQRYLGGRNWAVRALELTRITPGVEFRGRMVLARHVWVVFENEEAVALVDVEPYDDGTAGFAFVVAPQARGRGVGRRVLAELNTLPELHDVRAFVGGVEPDNKACRRCLERAGAFVAATPDDENMLIVRLNA